jgi:hypothetical protein
MIVDNNCICSQHIVVMLYLWPCVFVMLRTNAIGPICDKSGLAMADSKLLLHKAIYVRVHARLCMCVIALMFMCNKYVNACVIVGTRACVCVCVCMCVTT